MPRIMKFLYTITTRGLGDVEVLAGNVIAFSPNDAILEYITTRSSDPLLRYVDKDDASRHLGFFKRFYKAEVARKDGSPHGKPIRVKSR